MESEDKKNGAPLSEEAIALIEAELLRATAQRMIEDRNLFIGAHSPIDRQMIRSLVQRD